MWRSYTENIEVKPSIKDSSQMMWTCNYVSAISCYEKPKYFSLTQSLDRRPIFWDERRLNHFCFTSHNLCPWKITNSFQPEQAAILNSARSFLAVFTFILITYVTRYKKNRWHSCSEPTCHGKISSQLLPKTLRCLDENCLSRKKKNEGNLFHRT